jgi:outer membrane protein insertion porin family
LGASPSSSTQSGVTFFGNFQYQEKNLFGKAYGISTNLQLSPGVQSASSFNYSIGAGFTNPSLYDGPWSFGVNGNYSYQETLVTNSSSIEEAFITTKSISAGTNVGREIIEDLRFYLGYNVSFYEVTPSISLTKNFYPSEITQTLVYDDTDNNMTPTSGVYASASNAIGIEAIFGEYPYGKLSGNASYYYPISFTDGFKTNFRLTFQPQYVYQTNPNDSVPYWKRLTLGNTYTMKGYSGPGEQITPTIPVTISPITGQVVDFNIGGDRSYYGALEYFLPIIPEAGLRFVTFGEAGAVLDDYDDFTFDMVKYDIGFGFRWATPIAPFRFEWAFPVQNGQIGDAHFIFTIGFDSVGGT